MPAPSHTCRESTAEMTCPGCAQQFDQPGEQGQCPFCGYPCAAYQRYVTITQIIVGAVFASTLIYAGIVAAIELTEALPLPGPTVEETPLGVALLLASVVVLAVSVVVERAMLEKREPMAVQRAAIVLAAVAEAPAVFGLALYLLSGSIQWFVAFIAVSWAFFLRLGLRLPAYLHQISQELKAQR